MSEYTKPEKRKFISITGKERDGIIPTPGKISFSTESEEDIDGIRAFFKGLKSPKKAVLDYVEDLERFASNELLKAGFDRKDEFSGKSYKLANGGRGSYYAAIRDRGQTPVWYAAKIITEARFLKKHVASGDLFSALQSALLMEGARGDFNVANYEPETVRGMASANGYLERENVGRVETFKEWLCENPDKIKGRHTMKRLMELERFKSTGLAERTVRKCVNAVYPGHLKAGKPKKE